jgi:N-methylhydantoinase A/oxoprolinase/acetone carboxylase beta subunit
MAPLGERHLKDLDQPEQVYELAIEGVQATPVEETSASEVGEPIADFRSRLSEQIKQRVDRELRAAFETDLDAQPDDAAVDELAGRTADLGEQISARVEAALRARGISPGSD